VVLMFLDSLISHFLFLLQTWVAGDHCHVHTIKKVGQSETDLVPIVRVGKPVLTLGGT